jgi:hypothetical protein
MKSGPERLVLLAATVLSIANTAQAADKKVDASRKGTITEIQACMKAGFSEYEYKTNDRKKEVNVHGKVKAKGDKKNPKLTGGERSVTIKGGTQKRPQKVHELFIDDDADGFIDKFKKDDQCFDQNVDGRDDKCNEDCLNERYDPDVCCQGTRDAVNCTITQKTAQADYDNFLREAQNQCRQRGKTDPNFGRKLQKALK